MLVGAHGVLARRGRPLGPVEPCLVPGGPGLGQQRGAADRGARARAPRRAAGLRRPGATRWCGQRFPGGDRAEAGPGIGSAPAGSDTVASAAAEVRAPSRGGSSVTAGDAAAPDRRRASSNRPSGPSSGLGAMDRSARRGRARRRPARARRSVLFQVLHRPRLSHAHAPRADGRARGDRLSRRRRAPAAPDAHAPGELDRRCRRRDPLHLVLGGAIALWARGHRGRVRCAGPRHRGVHPPGTASRLARDRGARARGRIRDAAGALDGLGSTDRPLRLPARPRCRPPRDRRPQALAGPRCPQSRRDGAVPGALDRCAHGIRPPLARHRHPAGVSPACSRSARAASARAAARGPP